MKLLTPIARPSRRRAESPTPVCLRRRLELRRQGLVEDQQVDLVDTELAGALLEPVQSLLVAVVDDPDLGPHEHLRPVQTGGGDGFTDLPLVAIRGPRCRCADRRPLEGDTGDWART